MRSLIVEVVMKRYFRPIASAGSQPRLPSDGESSEYSSSQATQITVSASTSQQSSATAVSPVGITCHLEVISDKPNQPRLVSLPKVSFGKGSKKRSFQSNWFDR